MTSTRGSRGVLSPRRVAVPRLLGWPGHMSGPAWGAAAVVIGFIALTAWWLSVDRGVPYNDAAQHIFFAFRYRDLIDQGRLTDALEFPSFYPPATYLLGAAASFVAGVHVAVPILAQNLVFVPLLALACYRIGRMLDGPGAGLLAVLFALGAPLIIEQFHVFMLDVPQATLVAVAAWQILASDRFAKLIPSALAGLALGVAIASKSLAPLYLAGLVACVLVRGGGTAGEAGGRNRRGLAAFAALALLIGAPWYVRQAMLGEADKLLHAAGSGGDVPEAASPALLSGDNVLWYFWATLDGLLFAPLFAFATVGVGAAVARVVRARPRDDYTLELLCGLGASWLAMTLMPHKDLRYTVGLIVFVAVLGTVWIARLAPAPRTLAVALLACAIVAAQVGATFGVGGETSRQLPGARRAEFGEGVPPRDRVIVYENHNFIVSGPHRRPDVLALLRGLRREGVAVIAFIDQVESYDRHFEEMGLWVLARVAGLQVIRESEGVTALGPGQALAIRSAPGSEGGSCMTLADGSEVVVRVGVSQGGPGAVSCPRAG